MKILVACEYSGLVRQAFTKRGFDATSCDLLPTEIEGQHYQGDVFDIINENWDMMIAFPPCTYLTNAANRHFVRNPERWKKRLEVVQFVWNLWQANIERIVIENPIGALSSHIGRPNQIIHPYYFGDTIPKSTCLWLKNLPCLTYSLEDNLFEAKTSGEPEYIEYNSKSNKSGKSKYSKVLGTIPGKGKERSKISPHLAAAMAEQWGQFLITATEVA